MKGKIVGAAVAGDARRWVHKKISSSSREDMAFYPQMENCSIDRFRQWWRGDLPDWAESRELFLGEVAYALCNFGVQGIAFLKRELESDDPLKRRSALSATAYPETYDQTVQRHLLEHFHKPDITDKTAALWGFINSRQFPVERGAVEVLANGSDERLAALAMVYLSRAFEDEAVDLLRAGLASDNPRKREYACDEVGDRGISELAEAVGGLVDDPDPDVSQAAKSNYDMAIC